MLRKLIISLLILSGLLLLAASVVLIEYLQTRREIRFDVAEKPIVLGPSNSYVIDFTVDEPAPYVAVLLIDPPAIFQSWPLHPLSDSLMKYTIRPITFGAQFRVRDSAVLNWAPMKSYVSVEITHKANRQQWRFRLESDNVPLDTLVPLSLDVRLENVPDHHLGRNALIRVEMLRGYAKSIRLERYVEYRLRLYGLIAAGVFFLGFLVLWLRIR